MRSLSEHADDERDSRRARRHRGVALALALGLTALLPPHAADAWGAQGHRLINGAAIDALPADVPAFVRSASARAEIAALGPEADRLKGAGTTRDADEDNAHFLDLDDDGTVAGVVKLGALPPTREAYDQLVRTGHPMEGKPPDQYRAGYLPYAIIDGWQQVVKDFAIWRVDAYGASHAATPAARAAFDADRVLREDLTLRDIGYWGHFVGDGSQPLHVSIHYNGWGDYPNPNGYSISKKIHAQFESDFVNANATRALVQQRMRPSVASSDPYPVAVGTYLLTTAAAVPTVYQLYGADNAFPTNPQAVGFMLDRLAAGAQFLRDSIVAAWTASADAKVSYPALSVRDIESGAVPPPDPGVKN